MRILAISGSPRARSFTHWLLNLFLEGCATPADVVKPHELKFGHCRACFHCWVADPGRCVQDDDLTGVLKLMDEADAIILAVPLYVDGMPGPVKTMLDRVIPLLEYTFAADAAGHTRHPRRRYKHQRTVLLSSCAFPEADNFDSLRAHFAAVCRNAGWHWAGELLVPGAGRSAYPGMMDETYAMLKRAGQEFAAGRDIASDVTAALLNPTVAPEAYRQRLNDWFAEDVEEYRRRRQS
ncbi:MAG: flavodoxin family protein [Bacillota bacterium]